MKEFLIEQAVKNIWCSPDQDRQHILKLARLTPNRGARGEAKVMWGFTPLPDTTSNYHVYQIGQNIPWQFNLPDSKDKWLPLSDVCRWNKVVIDVYMASGIRLPLYNCFYKKTANLNILIAVKISRKLPSLDTFPLYIRFYSNSYFESMRSDVEKDVIYVGGHEITSKEDALLVQREWGEYANKPGGTTCFINGLYADRLFAPNIKVGDLVEFVYDSSIKLVKDFPIKRLPVFTSQLDSTRKYLVHLPKGVTDQIEYRDDIDVFIFYTGTSGVKTGRYYHRNSDMAIRNVTHQDFSLNVGFLTSYLQEMPETTLDKASVRLVVRKSGYARPLVYVHQRIHELYKLDDLRIIQAMTGINSVLEEWTASALENSAYCGLMMDRDGVLEIDPVCKAYGYNAITKMIADTPQFYQNLSGFQGVELPEGLREGSTVYEHDVDGKLVCWQQHLTGAIEYRRGATSVMCEVLSGLGGTSLNYVADGDEIPLDENVGYRFYKAKRGDFINLPLARDIWTDVTDTNEYSIISGKCHWNFDKASYVGLVLGDDKFLTYKLDLNYRDHYLKFTLNHWVAGNRQVLDIPLGKLDIWINGHPAVEGIDYYFKFPEVVIVNKKWLVFNGTEPYNQTIHVRFYGWATKDVKPEYAEQTGWLKYGLLSKNGRFDLRDDRVVRIVAGGKLLHRSQVKFAENDNGAYVSNIPDGQPYVINNVAVPIRGVTEYKTRNLRAISQELDARVSDYMSRMLPEPKFDHQFTIPDKYDLYSPFMAKVLYDIKNGILVVPEGHVSDATIVSMLKSYEPLLDWDPCHVGYDHEFVAVHPHDRYVVMEVKQYQYSFIARAARLFLNNGVNLSKFLSIAKE